MKLLIDEKNQSGGARARAVGRSVRRARTHGTGRREGGEGVVAASASDAAPAPPPPRPAARPPALAGAPRHIFHRQTANSGPTPLGAPRTTGEPPRRGRAVPGHGQAGGQAESRRAGRLTGAQPRLPAVARPVWPARTALSMQLPSPPLLPSPATYTTLSAAEVPALICYIYGAHWSADTSSTTPAT